MSVSFSLKFPVQPFNVIREDDEIFMTGSCFTENMGGKMNAAGFKTTLNPFGILFNPVSIANSINRTINKEVYKTSDLCQNQEGRFVSFDHHGRFSGTDADAVVVEINKSLLEAHDNLKTAAVMVITYGSAWVYRHLEQERLVANCHKIANKEFGNELLNIGTVVDSIQQTIDALKSFNPGLKLIFTISPVKHLRDGVIENQQSKATLILALAEVLKERDDSLYYFPAYEIVTDELRDYRFYEADHAHPNQLAIEYVWERFVESCYTPKAKEKATEAENLTRALSHKTLHTESVNENLQLRIKSYLKKYPLE